MKKVLLLAAVLLVLSALPVFASEDSTYPRFVILGEKAVVFADRGLTRTEPGWQDFMKTIEGGGCAILHQAPEDGRMRVCVPNLGNDGWIKSVPFAETVLAVCLGGRVNVRVSPVTGKIIGYMQLFKGQSVIVTEMKDVGQPYKWLRIYMIDGRAAWACGKYFRLVPPAAASFAAEIMHGSATALDNGGRTNSLAGLTVGAAPDARFASLAAQAGWHGPAHFKEGDNVFAGNLRLAEDVGGRVLHVKVSGGRVAEIRFDEPMD